MPYKSVVLYFACLISLMVFRPAGLLAGTLFATPHNFDTGGFNAQFMAIADVNGDGKVDVLVARQCAEENCAGTNSVVELLGNGDGTFATPLAVYPGATAVAIADMNHDGKPDLVAGTANQITVSLGRGDGTFASPAVYSAGGSLVLGLAVVDVNGDGKLDVLASYQCTISGCVNKHRAGVLIGKGDGTLKGVVTYALVGSGAAFRGAIGAADVNGDAKPDLVVLEPSSGYLTVLLGRGDGTFRVPHSFAVPFDAGGLQLVDLNGDGKVDVAVSARCGNPACDIGAMGVLKGNGDGTFQAVQMYLSGAVDATGIAIGDVNADGKLDIVVSNSCKFMPGGCAPGSVGVFRGNGDGTFNPVELYNSAGMFANAVGVTDVNGDQKPDVLVLNAYQNYFQRTHGSLAYLRGLARFETVTNLQSSLNPSSFGQAVTFTAAVTSASSTAALGSVSFFNGTTSIGKVTLDDGVAKLTISKLPVGVAPITAIYNGSPLFLKSTSPALNQTVTGAAAAQP